MLLIRNKKYLIKNQEVGRVCEAPPRRGRGKGFPEKPKLGIGAGTGMETETGTGMGSKLDSIVSQAFSIFSPVFKFILIISARVSFSLAIFVDLSKWRAFRCSNCK
ncbi:hypothetical protein L3X38_002443 [Prunus dulcis]|uniref:Uncharacterized protein n=1 Tax=Prunus dulcis TaxID=3755 RepID=A0AAD4ZKR6_PRUDU|nr:hypothetical protein L3X38_002443 [Prunus dulcis]